MTNGNNIDPQMLAEFDKNRNQLMGISAQKQQLQAQSRALKAAKEEIENSKEKKVFKAVGNILIQKDVAEMKKELKENIESADLRVKTLQKQEDTLVKKLNKIKSELEGSAGKAEKEEEKKEK